MIKWLKAKIWAWKKEREYQRKLKELKKRDPFTYKNF
tara:strand:+ start:70 stop:180 length:111 start_codon:yes stop_codon:yes gene_type:complete